MEKEPFWIIYALRLWNDLFLLYEISKGAHHAYRKTIGAMNALMEFKAVRGLLYTPRLSEC